MFKIIHFYYCSGVNGPKVHRAGSTAQLADLSCMYGYFMALGYSTTLFLCLTKLHWKRDLYRKGNNCSSFYNKLSFLRGENEYCFISMQIDKIWMKFNVYVKRKKCLESQEENYFLKMIKNIESIPAVINTYNGKMFYYSNQLKTGMPSIISRELSRLIHCWGTSSFWLYHTSQGQMEHNLNRVSPVQLWLKSVKGFLRSELLIRC